MDDDDPQFDPDSDDIWAGFPDATHQDADAPAYAMAPDPASSRGLAFGFGDADPWAGFPDAQDQTADAMNAGPASPQGFAFGFGDADPWANFSNAQDDSGGGQWSGVTHDMAWGPPQDAPRLADLAGATAGPHDPVVDPAPSQPSAVLLGHDMAFGPPDDAPRLGQYGPASPTPPVDGPARSAFGFKAVTLPTGDTVLQRDMTDIPPLGRATVTRVRGPMDGRLVTALPPPYAAILGPVGRALANHDPLGDLSMKYEVSMDPDQWADAAGIVSPKSTDPGGISYGAYQLSSNAGTLGDFLKSDGQKWKDQFAGIDPIKDPVAFGKVWKSIAARSPGEFFQAQHDFIKRTHYDPQVRNIESETGLNINSHSSALQNVIWSMATQHREYTPDLVAEAIAKLDSRRDPSDPDFDRALIKALYEVRIHEFPKLRGRYEQEGPQALKMLDSN